MMTEALIETIAAEMSDQMDARGWQVNRNQSPPGLHAMVTAQHLAVVEDYLADLAAAVAAVRADPPPRPAPPTGPLAAASRGAPPHKVRRSPRHAGTAPKKTVQRDRLPR